MNREASRAARPSLPWFGWIGLSLLLLGQLFTLWHRRPLSDYWYGLCWGGVTLLADACVFYRTGRCMLRDRRRDVLLMLALSAIAWWGLESANESMHAWAYSPSFDVPRWQQRLRATLFFSTLIPATFATGAASLALRPWRTLRARRPRVLPAGLRVAIAAVGAGLLLASSRLTEIALGLVLLGTLLLLDPINHARRRPSLLGAVERGDYRLPVIFAATAMATGLVGEMWNYPADPKWTYDVPIIDFARVFEMPLLGFFGYGLLALTIFAIYHFVRGLLLAPAPAEREDALALTGL